MAGCQEDFGNFGLETKVVLCNFDFLFFVMPSNHAIDVCYILVSW